MVKPRGGSDSSATEDLNVEIPADLGRRLAAFVAAEKGRTKKGVVAAALEAYLAQAKKKRGT